MFSFLYSITSNSIKCQVLETLFYFLEEGSWVKNETSYDVTSDKIDLRVAPD